MKFRLYLAFLLFFTIFPYAECAQPAQQVPIAKLLQQWNADLEQSRLELANPDIDDEALKQLREHVNGLRNNVISAHDKTAAEVNPLQNELTALGPPPAKDAPAESKSIAVKRKTLNEQLTAVQGQVKEAELLISGADEVLDQLSTLRIHRFTQKVFTRGSSALAPEVWKRGIPDLQEKMTAVKQQFELWRSEQTAESFKTELFRIALTIFSALAIVWPFVRWFSRKFGRTDEEQAPTYVELFRAALTVAFVRILLPMSITVAAYLLLDNDLDWQGGAHEFAFALLKACLMIVLVAAVSRAILAPFRGRWRLMPLNDADAHYVHKIIVGLAWVFAIDLALESWLNLSGASLELIILRKFLIDLLIAGLLLALLIRRQLWRMDIQHRRKKSNEAVIWRELRALISVLVLLIPISAIAGYVSLSRLLGTQIVITGGLYILVGVVIALCTELIEELLSKETELGLKIRQYLELTDDGSELLVFWLKAAVNTVIYFVAILTLLVIWGAGGEDLNVWLYNALFGFTIAGVTISISTIFLAIALFSGILLLTRLLQRFLELVILPRTRIDYGIQNSIRAAVGYIGFIIAAGFAISTMGIDLSKLAIIAGALSVGIGFGLQNVVNNFVSGLILLIERPIRSATGSSSTTNRAM